VVAVTGWLDTARSPTPGARRRGAGDRRRGPAAQRRPGRRLGGRTDTAQLVRSLGFARTPAHIDELEKAECGVTCLSVLLPASRSGGHARVSSMTQFDSQVCSLSAENLCSHRAEVGVTRTR
jgi:hypothetical protein